MDLKVGTEFTCGNDIGNDVVRGLRYKGNILKEGDKLPLKSIVDLVLGNGKG
jgi:hypothetical protein